MNAKKSDEKIVAGDRTVRISKVSKILKKDCTEIFHSLETCKEVEPGTGSLFVQKSLS
jgi:hypothetical protein